jgi:hypothetical protein
MRKWLILVCLMAMAAAQTLSPRELAVLVIGASAARPSQEQRDIVAQIQALRQNPALSGILVATMHFDRPREAAVARQVLGIERQMLPCVCLVQLDSSGSRPVKALKTWARVKGKDWRPWESVAEAWAAQAGQPLALMTPQLESSPRVSGSVASVAPVRVESIPTARPSDHWPAGVTILCNETIRSPLGSFLCVFQADGNLVVYSTQSQPYRSIWASQTQGLGAQSLRLGNDGVLRMFNLTGQVVWQAGRASAFSNAVLQMQDDGNLVLYLQDGNGGRAHWASRN